MCAERPNNATCQATCPTVTLSRCLGFKEKDREVVQHLPQDGRRRVFIALDRSLAVSTHSWWGNHPPQLPCQTVLPGATSLRPTHHGPITAFLPGTDTPINPCSLLLEAIWSSLRTTCHCSPGRTICPSINISQKLKIFLSPTSILSH